MTDLRPAHPVVVVAAVMAAALLAARDLKPDTLKAFDRYVQVTEARMSGELTGKSKFLWIDQQPEPEKSSLYQRLKKGEVIVSKLETRDGSAHIKVKNGLIHHWVGTILLEGATLDRVTAFVQDYGRYTEYFAPTVVKAQVRSKSADRYDITMRTSMKKIITVVLDADYTIDYKPLGPGKLYTRSVASNVREIQNPGEANEHPRLADQGTGYLWRLNNYCSFEQRPEGTYEQCESISLTRDVPFGLRLVIRPFVTGIPRETLQFTLGRVRAGVSK